MIGARMMELFKFSGFVKKKTAKPFLPKRNPLHNCLLSCCKSATQDQLNLNINNDAN